jgi:hypothetical protein
MVEARFMSKQTVTKIMQSRVSQTFILFIKHQKRRLNLKWTNAIIKISEVKILKYFL